MVKTDSDGIIFSIGEHTHLITKEDVLRAVEAKKIATEEPNWYITGKLLHLLYSNTLEEYNKLKPNQK